MSSDKSETEYDDALDSEVARDRTKKVSDQIKSMLEQQILEGQLAPGERLPTERDLAVQFNVSRSVARSAIMSLVEGGKVLRHVGRGSFVVDASPGLEVNASIFHNIAPAEMMEFRRIIEPGKIDLIMLNASKADLEAIGQAVAKGEFAQSKAEWNSVDDDFHRMMARATHNRLIITIYEAFHTARLQGSWFRLKHQTVNQDLWRKFQAQHRDISDALNLGDRDAAYKATRNHIMQARASMLGYFENNSGD